VLRGTGELQEAIDITIKYLHGAPPPMQRHRAALNQIENLNGYGACQQLCHMYGYVMLNAVRIGCSLNMSCPWFAPGTASQHPMGMVHISHGWVVVKNGFMSVCSLSGNDKAYVTKATSQRSQLR
jgi:hypothetical protein